jgi:uncharacterized protein YndB with AHSA1/START domain
VTADSRLQVQTFIAARPATVFRFLSDPVRFRAWMGNEADLGGDGGLRVTYPNGEVAEGRVLELVADTRLVFSYGYRNNPVMGPGTTTVRIELFPEDGGTRVVLTHENLPDAKGARDHQGGWRHYLSRLRGVAVSEQLSATAESSIDAYVAAWGETDSARRLALLERCWAERALFADSMGSAEGRNELDAYIAAAQRFMPGARLERLGSVMLVLDRARFAWRAVSADGQALGAGVNFTEFDGDGRIARLSGFWDPGGAG